ncbi:poly-gamma-glutamate synthesis protein (capsule biosynthesis protein) [Geomicrobium halophilum]|uniref:Poly-gamma-glutamate synthesis protein (Capsule biosynthesis protein) n=1 Tax=Geomicrobium halophilum TaxID=549000 RepID=A0A841PZV2_9BACL|nr:CapA family protein [Geomicrobium halophilum]MBB6448388.1 poly-gamma-glutamate synthesis protein (capsule biosynthesis protein) [Geomicrobium halophilum]
MRSRQKPDYNLKESMLARAKKHKKLTLPHTVIGAVVSLLILLSVNWWPAADVESVASDEEDDSFTASFVGDIMTGRYVEQVMDHRGLDFLFQYASPYFEDADYVTGNLENPVLLEGGEYEAEDKEIHLEAGVESVDVLEDAGFSVLNLANNHIRDYGTEGLQDTLHVFEESNMEAVGAYTDFYEDQLHIEEHNGIEVATVGFNDVWGASGSEGVGDASPEEALNLIDRANQEADLVVVHLHSGVEYTSTPTERQESLTKAYVDAGADIVVGAHPHVLQSVEVYNNGIIFYSLGNFVFDQGWTRTRDTALAQYELGEDGMAEIELVPFRIHEAQPRPIDGLGESYYRERIFQQLTKDTTDDSVYEKTEDGRLIFEVDHSHVLE